MRKTRIEHLYTLYAAGALTFTYINEEVFESDFDIEKALTSQAALHNGCIRLATLLHANSIDYLIGVEEGGAIVANYLGSMMRKKVLYFNDNVISGDYTLKPNTPVAVVYDVTALEDVEFEHTFRIIAESIKSQGAKIIDYVSLVNENEDFSYSSGLYSGYNLWQNNVAELFEFVQEEK